MFVQDKYKAHQSRRQILVVNIPNPLTDEEIREIRASLEKQMKSGIVILAGGIQAFTVDDDRVVLTDE